MRYHVAFEVQRLIEKQYLESANADARRKYQGASDFSRRLILTAYLDERIGGTELSAKVLQNILLS